MCRRKYAREYARDYVKNPQVRKRKNANLCEARAAKAENKTPRNPVLKPVLTPSECGLTEDEKEHWKKTIRECGEVTANENVYQVRRDQAAG